MSVKDLELNIYIEKQQIEHEIKPNELVFVDGFDGRTTFRIYGVGNLIDKTGEGILLKLITDTPMTSIMDPVFRKDEFIEDELLDHLLINKSLLTDELLSSINNKELDVATEILLERLVKISGKDLVKISVNYNCD